MRFPLFERHPREELSGYLDNELMPLRVEAMQAHLSSCPTCRAELDALSSLKSQLSALPESPAPRSFALTPAMAQRPAPEPARVRTPARVAALSNGMRLAGAGMAAAFAVVMVLNFSGSGSDSGGDDSASEAISRNSTTQYFDSADALATDVAPTATVSEMARDQDPFNTPVPPVATPARDVAGTPAAGGGVGGAPSSGSGGVGIGGDDSAPDATPTLVPGTIPEPTTNETAIVVPTDTAAALPQTGPGESVPSVVPGATDGVEKSLEGFDSRLDDGTQDSVASLDSEQPAPEAAPTTGTASDGDGTDILLLVAIALAAGVVLAFAGSALISRIARDEQ